VACHAVSEVARAAAEGADAAVLSPIFPSPGKGPPLGLEALREASSTVAGIQIVALGGVDQARGALCLAEGAGAVAAIRADLGGLLRQ
jgi:thiamine-phosphate pyrophosphorylase